MESGEFDIRVPRRSERHLASRALTDARERIGIDREVDPSTVSDEDIADAYRDGGFSDWPAELAGKVARALGIAAGLEHI